LAGYPPPPDYLVATLYTEFLCVLSAAAKLLKVRCRVAKNEKNCIFEYPYRYFYCCAHKRLWSWRD
jgi:hypothetical protein